MWKVVVGLEDVGSGSTFKEACKIMYDEVCKMLEKGTSWQVLETAVWIEKPGGLPCMFCEARDRACKEGWIKKGKWVG